jgi:type IV pilus assembly protein PilM
MPSLNSAWGIDVGNRALKAVRLVRGAEGIKIADVEIIEHEHILSQAGDNRDSLIQSALANFVQHQGGRLKGAIAVGVSGQSSFARFIKLPPVEPKKIPEIVRFEAIQQIPFPLDDVEWSYQLFQNEQSPDVEVGIFAMRRELVNRHIQYFTESGLDVELVQMNPLAVYNAMQHDRRIKGTTMVVDLGAENTDLIIAEGETIWLRSIPIGGNNFTEALVKSFKLKFPKAEELKRNAATSKYGRQILQAMRPVFADLVAEIQRSIGFYASIHKDSRISRVVALGGTFRLPGLQKYLQQNLQLEVARIDRLGNPGGLDAKVAATFSDNMLSCVSAYGLALQAMGDAAINSSLLPQKIRRERMWRDKTKWFATAAALVVAGTGVAYGSYYYLHLQDDKDHLNYGDKITRVLAQASSLDNEWKAVSDSGGPDRAQIQRLDGLLAGRDVWNNMLREIFGKLPPGPASIAEVEAMKAIPRGHRLQIVAHDFTYRYVPDVTMYEKDAMKDADFSLQVATAGGGGASAFGRMSAPQPPGGAAAATGPKVRGYLLTLRVTTPNVGGDDYVRKTVIEPLREFGDTSASTDYRITRAVVAISHKVTTASPMLGGLRNLRAFGGQPPNNGFNPGGADPLAQRRQPFAPVYPGGNIDTTPAGPIDPLADPLIPTESMKEDTEATLLIAVELDPPPRQPAAPATPPPPVASASP